MSSVKCGWISRHQRTDELISSAILMCTDLILTQVQCNSICMLSINVIFKCVTHVKLEITGKHSVCENEFANNKEIFLLSLFLSNLALLIKVRWLSQLYIEIERYCHELFNKPPTWGLRWYSL